MNLNSHSTALSSFLRKIDNTQCDDDGSSDCALVEACRRFHSKALQVYIEEGDKFEYIIELVICLLDSSRWEFVAIGGLIIKDTTHILYSLSYYNASLISKLSLITTYHIPILLENDEPRIRSIAGDALLQLCLYSCKYIDHNGGNDGSNIFETLWNVLISRIYDNYERNDNIRYNVLLGNESTIPLDDTTGWKTLETSFKALRELVNGYKAALPINILMKFINIDDKVSSYLITNASIHVNRYIREGCHLLTRQLIEIYCTARSNKQIDDGIHSLLMCISNSLGSGMSDKWCQIRHVSVITCKVFLSSKPLEQQLPYLPVLLPRLCLNRFYVAEGVKAASHDAWRSVMGSRGREMYATVAADAAVYYVEMSKSNSHMVSEAASHAMAELASRIDRNAVVSSIPMIIEALSSCMVDQSWPVRDAASLAIGSIVRYYPECITDAFDDIMYRWKYNLKDCIWSVRENAAIALSEVYLCNDDVIRTKCIDESIKYIDENILKAATILERDDKIKKEISFIPKHILQSISSNANATTATTTSNANAANGATTWRQGGGWGCCLDCIKPPEGGDIEISDGCFYLLRELISHKESVCLQYIHNEMIQLLAMNKHKDCHKLHTTIFEQIVEIAKRLSDTAEIFLIFQEVLPYVNDALLLQKYPLKVVAAENVIKVLSTLIDVVQVKECIAIYITDKNRAIYDSLLA